MYEELKKELEIAGYTSEITEDYGNHCRKTYCRMKKGNTKFPKISITELEGYDASAKEIADYVIRQTRHYVEKGLPDNTREYVLAHVIPQLVGKEGNREYLDGLLSVGFLDMAIIFRIVSGTGLSLEITKEMAKDLGLILDDVYGAAFRNNSHNLIRLRDYFRSNYGCETNDPAIIITNEPMHYGSGVMADMGAIREASEMSGGDLIIFPSSIHEVLAYPASFNNLISDPGALKDIVHGVNQTQVDLEEQLTGSVYYYDAKADEIRIIA